VVAIQPQQDVLLPELNSVPPIVHGSFIPSQDVHAFGEGKRTLTAGGHSGHQAVWPAPSSRRTSLSDCVPLFSSKRPSAGDRFAKRPAEAPSIPHWDCRRIDGSLLRIAQYRRCRDRPPQMSGSSPALRRGSNRPLRGGNYGYIFKFAHSSSPCRPSLSSLYILLLELLECKSHLSDISFAASTWRTIKQPRGIGYFFRSSKLACSSRQNRRNRVSTGATDGNETSCAWSCCCRPQRNDFDRLQTYQ
jgi:hypothetical protein